LMMGRPALARHGSTNGVAVIASHMQLAGEEFAHRGQGHPLIMRP
jgi:hypothetical protein